LVLRYLVEKRGWTGAVVRSVSTTRMIDRLAKRYELPLYETPVGFNHIADYMLNEDVLMGGEESGGISIKGHIPEGDGILMGTLLLEVMADAKASLHELILDIQREVGPTCYARQDIPLKRAISKSEMVTRLQEGAPAELAGESIVEILTLDGVKYVLADDAWLLIRPSGTEPVLRVYAEGRSPEEVRVLLAYGQQMAG
jgi:phosphomannomutase